MPNFYLYKGELLWRIQTRALNVQLRNASTTHARRTTAHLTASRWFLTKLTPQWISAQTALPLSLRQTAAAAEKYQTVKKSEPTWLRLRRAREALRKEVRPERVFFIRSDFVGSNFSSINYQLIYEVISCCVVLIFGGNKITHHGNAVCDIVFS